MNAPKKILMADECQSWAERDEIFHIPYIRADIVDELAQSTNALAKADFGSEGWNSSLDQLALRIRAALAKLEESHD